MAASVTSGDPRETMLSAVDRLGDRSRYEPTFWVTELVSNRHGGRREVQGKLARHLAPIRPDEDTGNAAVLFGGGGRPTYLDMARFAHDAVLQFYDREQEFSILNVNPGAERIEEEFWRLLEGKDRWGEQLHTQRSKLGRNHGVTLDNLYRQEVSRVRFDRFVDGFTSYRAEQWEADIDGVVRRTLEQPTESRRLSGRVDMLVETDNGYEAWDGKMTMRSPPVERHSDQARIYAWQLDAVPVVDYPVQQERHRPDYDPDEVRDMVLDQAIDFGQKVMLGRRIQGRVMENESGITREDGETLEDYRLRIHADRPEDESYAIAQKAAEEGLKAV